MTNVQSMSIRGIGEASALNNLESCHTTVVALEQEHVSGI